MKHNQLIGAISSFLIPTILIFASFVLVGFFKDGFEMVFYAAIFLFVASMLYLVSFNTKISKVINLEYIGYFLSLMAICYLAGLLLMVVFYGS
jgi:hypothetical protein